MIVVGVAAASVAGWVVAPIVGMRRRGTLDERHLAAIREETRRLAATRRPVEGPQAPPNVTVLPTPREAADGSVTTPAPSRATPA